MSDFDTLLSKLPLPIAKAFNALRDIEAKMTDDELRAIRRAEYEDIQARIKELTLESNRAKYYMEHLARVGRE